MVANIFFGSTEETRDELELRYSPYTKKIVSKYPLCTKEDTQKALLVASKAANMCRNSTLSQRIAWLEDVALSLEENLDDIAKTITDEVGKPIYFSKIEVSRAIETIKITTQVIAGIKGETIPTDIAKSGKKAIAYYQKVPVGVVACITPFNFPLNLIIHKLAPALIAGNSVVLKPTPEAPLTAYKIAKLFIESPYAIKDALSLVYGDAIVGNALVSSDIPRVLSFTGSVQVGNIITKNAGIKKLSLELGGNAATYIEKSADIANAAARCAYGAFYNSGQVCISLQRIYIDEEIYDDFAATLVKEALKLKVGDPYSDNTFIGPMINDDAISRALNWVEMAKNEGAKVLLGNKSEGSLFYPTIMGDVRDDMNIVCEEVFAPIVSLVKVSSYDEAIQKINNSPYGLQYSIFTNDLNLTKRFIDDAQCGGVVINDIPTLRFDVQPYGGVKLSGIGKEGPEFAIEEFMELKSIVIC
ncbi:MAG: aldehyde dehydrogenase family protein [Arcobacteraceae bacterium]|nr:aldehyde dehydrogenase family protein [Arcobacteraceae bacterium]